MNIRFKGRVDLMSGPRMFCAASRGAGNGVGSRPETSRVQFYRSEINKAIQIGSKDGLNYLEYALGAMVEEGMHAEARQFLPQVKQLLAQVDLFGFRFSLSRFAEYSFKMGELDEAKQFFDQAMGLAQTRQFDNERDEIRGSVAAKYIYLGEHEEALKIAGQIEQMTPKFNRLIEIADSLIESGNSVLAKEVLLAQCAAAARERDLEQPFPRNVKTHRLMEIAQRLIALHQLSDGEKLLDEAAKNTLFRCGMVDEDFKQLEDIAILLLGIGKKQKAIDVVLGDWLDLSHYKTSEEKEARKLRFVNEHHGCERFAKALAVEGKQQGG